MTITWDRDSRWVPGPVELVFVLVLTMLLTAGRYGLLNDPGTPWHLRLGREILATGAVPRYDTLTFTHDHAAWVDQSWAFDVLLALLVDSWGWSAPIGLASLGLATLYAAMARGLIRDGHSPVVVLVVSLFATAIGTIHFLIRPHLFTFAFVYSDVPGLPEAAPARRLVRRGRPVLHGYSRESAWRVRGPAGDRGHRCVWSRDCRTLG